MDGGFEKMNKHFEQIEKRLERIENVLERLLVNFNEFVDFYRETFKAQHDRIGNRERRMDRLERRS